MLLNPTTAVFLDLPISRVDLSADCFNGWLCHERTLLLLNKEEEYQKGKGKGAPALAPRQTGAYSGMRKAGKSVSEIIAELGVSKCSVVK